jgi:hypothetical protein
MPRKRGYNGFRGGVQVMTSADLGFPVLFSILVFWGLFAVAAIASTFLTRANLEDFKQALRRFFDEESHHKGSV